MVKCQICGKEYSEKGIGTHIWRKHGSGKNFDPNRGYKNGTRKIWNKGLTRKTDSRVNSACNTLANKIETGEVIPSFKGKQHSEKTKKQISQTVSDNIRVGKQNGWTKFKSYPELFFEEVLRNHNLLENCIQQYHMPNGKRNYFLDFFFPDKKLDLEIDGAQHKFRKESDIRRDSFLKECGLTIYRIKWNSVNSKKGSLLMKKKISDFLEFYNNFPQ